MGKPTFKQILDALKGQILGGKSYLGIAKGLLSADPYFSMAHEHSSISR